MSDENNTDSHQNNPFQYYQNMGFEGFSFPFLSDQSDFNPFLHNQQLKNGQNPNRFDPFQMSSAGFLHDAADDKYNAASSAFDLPCSSSDHHAVVYNSVNNDSSNQNVVSASENPFSTNSSVSFSSSEAGAEEGSSRSKIKDLHPRVSEDADVKSKKE
ncbi:WRKY DNA-binding protein 28 [Dorcoceras hygrometricum]|uniref:WRKY DNA-binding protein 28 n=1 Tax=Dorcoceras hygrometricum TaxID=472368 RepID=A0A2Z7AED4_9LAMI|nr:WRKY DNA-binding protein 28 [Dorcoceras hygrometricum]